MQVVLVCRQPFCRNSVLKCALHSKIAKNLLKRLLKSSKSFKVIDVDNPKKSVINACYDKHNVCTYLQLSSLYTSK